MPARRESGSAARPSLARWPGESTQVGWRRLQESSKRCADFSSPTSLIGRAFIAGALIAALGAAFRGFDHSHGAIGVVEGFIGYAPNVRFRYLIDAVHGTE